MVKRRQPQSKKKTKTKPKPKAKTKKPNPKSKPKRKKRTIHTLPAGTYIIGDPCHHGWVKSDFEKIQNKTTHSLNCFEFKGEKMMTIMTGSDGEYTDNLGKTYFLDSATFGIIPKQISQLSWFRKNTTYGREFEFKRKFTVAIKDNLIVIGNVKICIA